MREHFTGPLRAALAGLDPNLRVYKIETLEDVRAGIDASALGDKDEHGPLVRTAHSPRRQAQLEADLAGAWGRDPVAQAEQFRAGQRMAATKPLHGKANVAN